MVDVIQQETTDLLQQRKWFQRINAMIEANPQLKAVERPFIGDIVGWYGVYAIMGIRRQADKGKDVRSLRRVLGEIIEHRKCLTRENIFNFYRERASSFPVDVHERMVDAMWTPFSKANGKLNVAVIQKDLADLESFSKAFEDFATEVYAHSIKKGTELTNIPTFPELDAAIDSLDAMVTRYLYLLAGTVFMTRSNEAVEGFDWRNEFRFAWLPPDETNA